MLWLVQYMDSQPLQVPKERWSHEIKKEKKKNESTLKMEKHLGALPHWSTTTEHEESFMKLDFVGFFPILPFSGSASKTVCTSNFLRSCKMGKRFNGTDFQKQNRGSGVKLSYLDIPDYFVIIF